MRVSLIIPKTKNNKLIIAKRTKDKHPFPNTWVCAVGGKANDKETFEECAKREMKEEVNFNADLIEISTFKHIINNLEWSYKLFTTKIPLEISQLMPDPVEIQYLQEFSIKEIDSMIKQNPSQFAPTFIVAFNTIKESSESLASQ